MRGLSEHQLLVFLLQFAVLLAGARLLGALARRLGQPSVMGEVIAGVLLGPTVFGHLLPGIHAAVFPKDPQQGGLLELLSWIGMILLMLRTGIDTDVSRWRTLKGPALLASVFGIAVPFAVGIGVGLVVPASLVGQGGRGLFTVFVGTAMSISAVKVIAKILLDLNLMRRDVGFVILGASIMDDTIGWVILAIVVRVASTGSFGLGSVAATLGATVGFALAAMLVVRPLAGRAIRWLEREGRLEHGTTSAVLVLALACGALTQALGIHAIFGAFVAGLIVGESPRIREATLDSIDAMVIGVFAPVFFAYSGLKVEALALPGWPVTLLVLGGAILGKVLGAGAGQVLTATFTPTDRVNFSIPTAGNVTGGYTILFATPGASRPGKPSGSPTLGMYVIRLEGEPYRALITEGAKLIVPPTHHLPPDCLPRQAKMRSRLHWWLAELQAREADPDASALLADKAGHITETAAANFLIVRKGTITSPPRNQILDGISLMVVEELCASLGVKFEEHAIKIDDCLHADEALLTSTPYGVVGVAKINGKSLRWPGPMLKKLHDACSKQIGKNIWSPLVPER